MLAAICLKGGDQIVRGVGDEDLARVHGTVLKQRPARAVDRVGRDAEADRVDRDVDVLGVRAGLRGRGVAGASGARGIRAALTHRRHQFVMRTEASAALNIRCIALLMSPSVATGK